MLIKFLDGTEREIANLYGADLLGANLQDVKHLDQFQVCPELGAFIAFKKLASGKIATLLIPNDAKRVNAYGSRKCRAEFVYVQQLDEPSVAKHDGETRYAQGTRVECDKFDPDPRIECSGGIHFFMTRAEAEEY